MGKHNTETNSALGSLTNEQFSNGLRAKMDELNIGYKAIGDILHLKPVSVNAKLARIGFSQQQREAIIEALGEDPEAFAEMARNEPKHPMRRGRKPSKEVATRRAKVLEMRASGKTFGQISKELGIPYATVQQDCWQEKMKAKRASELAQAKPKTKSERAKQKAETAQMTLFD
jgi:hypothetical protein